MMDFMIEFILWRTIDIGTGILCVLDKLIKLIKLPFSYTKKPTVNHSKLLFLMVFGQVFSKISQILENLFFYPNISS
jgi:hypothetical protein